MTHPRPWVRTGLALLVLTAGALAVATVVNPAWRAQLFGTSAPSSAAHTGGAPQVGTPSATAAPALDLSGLAPAQPGGASRLSGGEAGGAPRAPGATSTPPALAGSEASGQTVTAEVELNDTDDMVGGQGLRWPPRASTFASVAGSVLDRPAVADFDLPDEPTGAGIAPVASLPGGVMDLSVGGAAGSFAAATQAAGEPASERRSQLPAHPSLAAGAAAPVLLATAVPEPGAMALMVLGLGLLAGVARRRRGAPRAAASGA